MAGAGKKTFASGEVLTASDVNDYLMDQAVMRFDSSAARSSAVPTPSEGMVSYLSDTDAIQAYNGTAWVDVSSNIPYAVSTLSAAFSGSVVPLADIGNSGVTSTITFPAGRFSVAPVVTATPGPHSANSYPGIAISTVTSSAVSFFVVNLGAGTASPTFGAAMTSWEINVFAAQYSSGSATG